VTTATSLAGESKTLKLVPDHINYGSGDEPVCNLTEYTEIWLRVEIAGGDIESCRTDGKKFSYAPEGGKRRHHPEQQPMQARDLHTPRVHP
jgi:hypothetical protein